MNQIEALQKAISIVGSQTKLASKCPFTRSHLSFWLHQGDKIKAGDDLIPRCPWYSLDIEIATEGKVLAKWICPAFHKKMIKINEKLKKIQEVKK